MSDTETTTRKPRTTGKLVWLRQERVGFDIEKDGILRFAPIEGQPDHADIAAASKWLSEEIANERLPAAPATYALHRAICTATPRLEVTKKAVLL